MFCKNCGNQIDDKAFVCPHCGIRTQSVSEKGNNNIAIVGFVLSFFIAIAGLICSIIGYERARTDNLEHQGLALAGIIISSISIVICVIYFIILISLISAVVNAPYNILLFL